MTDHDSRTITRTDWLLLAALVALVLPIRLWLLYNTEVISRDGIGYIRYALQFERMPWQEVWQKNHQHPVFPLCVYGMSVPIRAIDGGTTTDNMALSAQLVNLIASFVLLVPMYLLGRQFFDRTVSFGATLLYQYLPISAQHLSDGISEPVYLVFLVSALLFMARAFHERRLLDCSMCGAFTGLAYLTRPEGGLVLGAFCVSLLACQCFRAFRRPWKEVATCGGAMVLTAILVGSVYVITTGHLSNKPTVSAALGDGAITQGANADPASGVSGFLFAYTFQRSNQWTHILQGVRGLAMEICQGLHYVAAVPMLLGMWWTIGSLRKQAAFWAVGAYAAIHVCILMRLAMLACYISDRHVMILVLLASFFVLAGLREVPQRVLGWISATPGRPEGNCRVTTVCFGILLVALVGTCLPKSLQRIHGNRVANREAGLWLVQKKRVQPEDHIIDDHAWSHYYSGLMFWEGIEHRFPKDHKCSCYVVITRSRDSDIDAGRGAQYLEDDAEVVWHSGRTVEDARVIVYEQRRRFDKNPWQLPMK